MKKKTTVQEFKNVMIDMYKGYPKYTYFGTFEKAFGKEAPRIIKKLSDDGIIESYLDIKMDMHYYELTSSGMDFAIAMINLNFSQKMHSFTKVLITATVGMFVFAFLQILVSLWT